MDKMDDAVEILQGLDEKDNVEVDFMLVLPDGSGFATASFPLPEDHWIYRADGFDEGEFEYPPMELRIGTSNPNRKHMERMITKAGRYAVRAATENGNITDFDPDALVRNLVIGFLGYYTGDGLSGEDYANPPKFRRREKK